MNLRPSLRRSSILLSLALLAPVHGARAAEPPSPLDGYRAAIVANPGAAVNYYRVFLYGRNNSARRQEARKLLAWCFQRHPRGHRIEMFIAWLDQLEGREGWEAAFRRSMDGMRATGDNFGVTYAGEILAYILIDQGRLHAADTLLASCLPSARRTGKAWMIARIWSVQAVLAQVRGDYSTALHLLRRTHEAVFPGGEYDIQCSVTTNLGNVYWHLGRYRKAHAAFAEAVRLRAAAKDAWGESIPAYNMVLCGLKLVHEGLMDPDALEASAARVLELASRSGNADVEAGIHNVLGQRTTGRPALAHFATAMAIARRHGLGEVRIESLRLSGNTLAAMGPDFAGRARRALCRAERAARETHHTFQRAETLADKARFEAIDGRPEEAIAAHLRAIGQIESLRAPQVPGAVRAQAFSHWADVYYRLAGLLLSRAAPTADGDPGRALAFHTMERYRARELLERLDTPRRHAATPGEKALEDRHLAVLGRISGVQRTLIDLGLEPADRRKALWRLKHLEEEERSLRDRLNSCPSRQPGQTAAGIPSLGEIRSLLAPDQALLSFQLWDGEPWARPRIQTGTSWLLVVTRDAVRSFPLPARGELRGGLEILEGLLTARDASPAKSLHASVRFYRHLFGQALAALPPTVHRLVIVPDDALCSCPFGALRASPEAAPLGRRFQISTVPSAAVWARLKRQAPGATAGTRSAALILFAPRIRAARGDGTAFRAAGIWRNGLRLDPLPHAAEEAAALQRIAGPGTRVLSGAAASEAALKETAFGPYAILDLVTHAVVDVEQPERSAIILAPGNEREDGLLQVREIPGLPLDGQLVILSSCDSSSGRLLGGEGAQSLARSFLGAGAGAVLASLWPLEDSEAAALLGRFATELGHGLSVAEALRRARSAAMDSGVPPSGWAGVIVLGNGDLAPLPAPRPAGRHGLLTTASLTLILLLTVLFAVLLIRRPF